MPETAVLTTAPSLPLNATPPAQRAAATRTRLAHRGSAALAGLLAFAGPLTFFTGALSVMQAPSALALLQLGLWWMLYGMALWGLLVIAGAGCERLSTHVRSHWSGPIWFLGACLSAALPNVITAGRASLLIEHGLIYSAWAGHLHAFTVSLVMALLYFAHLRRSRDHEQAAGRLAAAQAAQRLSRRRIIEARLQEMQARIDPQMLFDLLDTVRRLYERDAAVAERFLDDLITFLRTALPRLRTPSSSLLREIELARAFIRLHALARDDALDLSIDVARDAMHARFPPGVLLPLLSATVVGAGPCRLEALRADDACRVALTLPAAPSEQSVLRVRTLLADLHGAAAGLQMKAVAGAVHVTIEVPCEPA